MGNNYADERFGFEERDWEALSDGTRWLLGLIGFGLIVGSALLWWFPPPRHRTETSIEHRGGKTEDTIKTTTEHSDQPAFGIAGLVAGVALLVYSINGVKIVSFDAGRVKAGGLKRRITRGAKSLARRLKRVPSRERTERIEEAIEGPHSDEPPAPPPAGDASTARNKLPEEQSRSEEFIAPAEAAPTGNAVSTVKLGGQEFRAYPRDAIPPKVLCLVFSRWDEHLLGFPLPKNVSEIDFALRKDGPGNHPWLIKFKEMDDPVIVSSGRGRIYDKLFRPEPEATPAIK